MGMNCGCPAAESLASLTIPQCKESLGQIQKVIFQRRVGSSGLNNIPAASIIAKTSMASLQSATDGTKIVVSPFIQNPETEPGAARTFGGGNQTPGGIEIIIGREPTAFTGVIRQEPQSVIKTLKSYQCEDLAVFLIDEYGNIAAQPVYSTSGSTSTITGYKGFPIESLFIGDKDLGGTEEPDSNAINWSFKPNWSDDLVIVKQSTMDYNPLDL